MAKQIDNRSRIPRKGMRSRIISQPVLLPLLITFHILSASGLYAEEITQSMRGVYEAFKELQPYLLEESAFVDQKNRELIGGLLRTIKNNMHEVEDLDSRYQQKPGFGSYLHITNEYLGEVFKSFESGKADFAHWKARNVANLCISCHTSYGVNVRFYDPQSDLAGLDDYKQGEFFLASRQFDRAQAAFYRAAMSSEDHFQRMQSLRKWLIIYTRVDPQPKEAGAQLDRILQKKSFAPVDRGEVEQWLVSLKAWGSEKKSTLPPLKQAEGLMRKALGSYDPLSAEVNPVELLRAAAILHAMLENQKLASSDRSRALYLLGLAYTRLPEFYINEIPEFFLEECIREYRGTPDARQAYRVYKDWITRAFTGIGGSRLPADVLLKLKELHDLAYGLVSEAL